MALFNFCGFFYFFRFPRRKSFVGQLADLKLVPQLKGSKNIFFEQTPQSANLHLFHIILDSQLLDISIGTTEEPLFKA